MIDAVISHLDIEDIRSLSLVNKEWNCVVAQNKHKIVQKIVTESFPTIDFAKIDMPVPTVYKILKTTQFLQTIKPGVKYRSVADKFLEDSLSFFHPTTSSDGEQTLRFLVLITNSIPCQPCHFWLNVRLYTVYLIFVYIITLFNTNPLAPLFMRRGFIEMVKRRIQQFKLHIGKAKGSRVVKMKFTKIFEESIRLIPAFQ